jgi:hypothetical protein
MTGTQATGRPMSHGAFGLGASAARRAWELRRRGSVSRSRRVMSPELDNSVLQSGLKASE